MAKKKISIMGCGWLGLPLAEKLVQTGYHVKGSTTTPAKMEVLRSKGIEPFLLSFPENVPQTELADFLDTDFLIFNLPPSRYSSGSAAYEHLLLLILESIPSSLQGFLFVSSTSVYPELNREVFEQDALPAANAGSLMLRCEYLIKQNAGAKTTFLRFGGLMGGNRHPGRFLAGKTDVPQPDGPVNMIHLTDCVRIIQEILALGKWGYVFNACAPQHPSREAFYTKAAQMLHLPPPAFTHEGTPGFKIINSDFLQQTLAYQFTFPDPLACLTHPSF